MSQPLEEPLDPGPARQLIREIIETRDVRFSSHALQEMAADDLTTVDCVPEYERGTWRYCVCTNRITVVVAFRGATALTVVTTWRISP